MTSDRFNFVSTTGVSDCPLREDLAGGEGDGGGDGEGDRDLTAASWTFWICDLRVCDWV